MAAIAPIVRIIEQRHHTAAPVMTRKIREIWQNVGLCHQSTRSVLLKTAEVVTWCLCCVNTVIIITVHRHQTDHKCSALPDKQARIKPEDRIKEIIGKELNKEKKGPGGMRNERRAAKVALMKIKMKAIGDPSVPQDERVYLRVLMPLGNKEREQPMFFSKYWTIGKIIDKIAVAAKLKNENNVNVTEKKLRLINRNTGELLTLQDTLEYLLAHDDEPLLNGSTVIMEYVDKNLSSVLPDLDKYPR
ncbi:AN1-type zinc finger protein 1-like isoform X2 [Porites lutea]|uniref:AN1-type zinc finger protein 1-like isoform X2 n=1 Tax=Porites lutea TaxID=51062 RepID=UPI003CC68A82